MSFKNWHNANTRQSYLPRHGDVPGGSFRDLPKPPAYGHSGFEQTELEKLDMIYERLLRSNQYTNPLRALPKGISLDDIKIILSTTYQEMSDKGFKTERLARKISDIRSEISRVEKKLNELPTVIIACPASGKSTLAEQAQGFATIPVAQFFSKQSTNERNKSMDPITREIDLNKSKAFAAKIKKLTKKGARVMISPDKIALAALGSHGITPENYRMIFAMTNKETFGQEIYPRMLERSGKAFADEKLSEMPAVMKMMETATQTPGWEVYEIAKGEYISDTLAQHGHEIGPKKKTYAPGIASVVEAVTQRVRKVIDSRFVKLPVGIESTLAEKSTTIDDKKKR